MHFDLTFSRDQEARSSATVEERKADGGWGGGGADHRISSNSLASNHTNMYSTYYLCIILCIRIVYTYAHIYIYGIGESARLLSTNEPIPASSPEPRSGQAELLPLTLYFLRANNRPPRSSLCLWLRSPSVLPSRAAILRQRPPPIPL